MTSWEDPRGLPPQYTAQPDGQPSMSRADQAFLPFAPSVTQPPPAQAMTAAPQAGYLVSPVVVAGVSNVPGLELLAVVDSFYVKLVYDPLNCGGLTAPFDYQILNPQFQPMYVGREGLAGSHVRFDPPPTPIPFLFFLPESDCCSRLCCRTRRGLTMRFTDATTREVLKLDRPFTFSFWMRLSMTVSSPLTGASIVGDACTGILLVHLE